VSNSKKKNFELNFLIYMKKICVLNVNLIAEYIDNNDEENIGREKRRQKSVKERCTKKEDTSEYTKKRVAHDVARVA